MCTRGIIFTSNNPKTYRQDQAYMVGSPSQMREKENQKLDMKEMGRHPKKRPPCLYRSRDLKKENSERGNPSSHISQTFSVSQRILVLVFFSPIDRNRDRKGKILQIFPFSRTFKERAYFSPSWFTRLFFLPFQTFSLLNLEKKLFFLSFFMPGIGCPGSGNTGSNLLGAPAPGLASSVGPLERKKSARSPVLLCW